MCHIYVCLCVYLQALIGYIKHSYIELEIMYIYLIQIEINLPLFRFVKTTFIYFDVSKCVRACVCMRVCMRVYVCAYSVRVYFSACIALR